MVLKLQGMKLEGLPSAVDLPLLKVLHLEDLTISEFKSLAELLSGCPNLEDLKTMGLFITCYESYREIKTLPKLVRADVSLESTYVLFRDVVENVKFLRLDEIYDVVLNESARQYPDFIPMFHNLTRIELDYCKFNSDCSEVVELLNHCPKLQDLVIDQPNVESDLFEEPLQYPSSVPECILSHLQRCYINCYRGTKGEFRFAKYIMENGRFLKRMTISSGIARNPQRKRKMLKELSSCARQSETCKLSFK
ncbi:putative F-box/FBD/LRR-repeat protein At5g62970 [Lotus japonicus]|uniref:putative F-box/FBD/LRR-repeat protein At5g62970 n=1 Tax=Lotus japonicus TaxID=34305 RepID=UPI00258F5657|nr:putative F-box/FBD/LRR-repeat protein At5g62970 [Lotus japonicus]